MSLRVLIVDDSAAMRSHLRRVLAASGLPIETIVDAADGAQGLLQLQQHEINLILSDLNMPTMDGEEFVKRVKADENLRNVPVIMVTTDNSTDRVMKMRQMGCDGYITKPFTPDIVKQKVLAVMGA